MNDCFCISCGKKLTGDEIGCFKKTVNRGATEFMCLDCLARKFSTTADVLKTKIEEWRKSGCLLFPEN